MYKMNETLEYIISLLIITSIIFINNKIVFWFFLLILSVYNLYNRRKILTVISFILIVLLALSLKSEILLFIFKIGFIIDFLYTFYLYSIKNNKVQKRGKRLETCFNEDNFDRVSNKINKKKDLYYSREISTDYEIERILKREFLESRIRFYGFNRNNNKKNNWNKIDTLILIFSIIIFTIIMIIGR